MPPLMPPVLFAVVIAAMVITLVRAAKGPGLFNRNSITLTPGTVSARVEEDPIEVHALDRTRAAAEHAVLDRKGSRLEGGG